LRRTAHLSGTVKDATTGEALIGVNVTGKGTTIGTVTDIDGKYTSRDYQKMLQH
jgi:hypothetical protein